MDQAIGTLAPALLLVLLGIKPEEEPLSVVRDNVVVFAHDLFNGPLAIIIAKDDEETRTIKATLSGYRGKLLNGHTVMCAWKGSATYGELLGKSVTNCRHTFDNGTYKVRITEIKSLWEILNENQADD